MITVVFNLRNYDIKNSLSKKIYWERLAYCHFFPDAPDLIKVTSITRLFSCLFYFIAEESGKGIQMTYKLMPRKCREVKSIVEAGTKKAAILYFAALYHLSAEDLLEIYKIG